MEDYVRKLMDAWTNDGEQVAYDLAPKLLKEISIAYNSLKTQSEVIRSLIQHLVDTGKVTELAEPKPGLDTIEESERPRLITEAAFAIWRENPPQDLTVTGQEVLTALNNNRLDLGVKQPLAVIGTVLASANGWTKVARNTFEYKREVEDLPF